MILSRRDRAVLAIRVVESLAARTAKSPAPMSDPSDRNDRAPRLRLTPPRARRGFLRVLGAVFSSFLGIRKKASGERDMVTIKPLHVIIAGILGARDIRRDPGHAGALHHARKPGTRPPHDRRGRAVELVVATSVCRDTGAARGRVAVAARVRGAASTPCASRCRAHPRAPSQSCYDAKRTMVDVAAGGVRRRARASRSDQPALLRQANRRAAARRPAPA